MYLTKLLLPLNSWKTAEVLRDCQKMHCLISSLFDSSRQEKNLLYRSRIEKNWLALYLYSDIQLKNLPEGIHISGERNLMLWLEDMKKGKSYGFDLLTSPSRKVFQPGQDKEKNSQRRILRRVQERMDWLNRKAGQNGFQILQVQEMSAPRIYGRHKDSKGGSMYWNVYHYQGILCIMDEEKFRQVMQKGIGPGKAYGLGMLLVKNL